MLPPAGIATQRPCREKLLFRRRSCVPPIETAPTPVFRPLHQIRSQSIAFHIPALCQKVIIILRPNNQVPVIFHQTIRKQPRPGSRYSFLKDGFKPDEVFVL